MKYCISIFLLTAFVFADNLDTQLSDTHEIIAQLREDEAAVEDILSAIHDYLAAAREQYNELALEETSLLRELSTLEVRIYAENSLKDELIESISTYMIYLYSHRNLSGFATFFVDGGFSTMLRRQAYIDYLVGKAGGEVLLLSMSQDSLEIYTDSLVRMLNDVQVCRNEMEGIQESFYVEEEIQAELMLELEERIACAEDSIKRLEDRQSRSSFVTSVSSSGSSSSAFTVHPSADSWLENNKGNVSWPAGGTVIKHFGVYEHPEYGTELSNDGITVATNNDSQVCSVAGGIVLYASEFLNMGKMVIVDHVDGLYTVYGYLGSLQVSLGEEIETGEVLGAPGTLPGRRTGYYFEIRQGGTPVNPEGYLR